MGSAARTRCLWPDSQLSEIEQQLGQQKFQKEEVMEEVVPLAAAAAAA